MENNNKDNFFEEETTKNDYEKISKLGSGAYGSVYKARMKKNQKIVAIKRIKIDLDTEGIPSSALREISILRNLHHENIEKILDIITTETKLYMVLEFMEFDLQSFFEKLSEEPKITNYSHEELTKIILRQILKGVEYLHSKKIIHRDLKPQNILINRDLLVKLADFGLSRKISFEKKPYTQEVLSLWYRAPELLMGSNIYDEGIDIWSIGCIFAFMVLKNTLFEGESEIDQLNKIMQFLGTPNFNQIPYYNKSKFGYHNMYKEVRSTSLNGAVAQLTSEMVGRHKAQRESLVIVRTTELKGNMEHDAKRRQIRQVAKHDIKFPLLHKRIRPAPAFRKVFRPSRPVLLA